MTSSSKEKNRLKYLSYSEANRRMKNAYNQGFYLEAITIQESIISDRLLSYLVGKKLFKITEVKVSSNEASLFKLIKALGVTHILYDELDKWRDNRNKCVHSIAKSYPGQPTMSVEVFLEMAKETAEKGISLVRKVNQWHKTEKRKTSP